MAQIARGPGLGAGQARARAQGVGPWKGLARCAAPSLNQQRGFKGQLRVRRARAGAKRGVIGAGQ